MEKITINKNDLHDILKQYDEDHYESTPLHAESFVNYIFSLYQQNKKDTK